MATPTERRYRVLAYAIERKGLPVPGKKLESGKYTIEFAPYEKAARFEDFDGVIVFQGTFEQFAFVSHPYLSSRSHLKHTWDRDELDKRTKEAFHLAGKRGIICVLLTERFIDSHEARDFRSTDLSKRLLLGSGIAWRSFRERRPLVTSKVNELKTFFDTYGAAWCGLSWQGPSTKPLASAGGETVAVVSKGSVFVIPTLVPSSRKEAVEEYFTTLVDGLVRLWEQLRQELPDWAAAYRLPGETEMLERRKTLRTEISGIDTKLKEFERLKRVLVLQGEPLVEAVMEVFDKALPLRPQREEALKEDFVLVDSGGNTVALVEVKGVSKGITREHVNQADSHRERSGMAPEFPSLLIVNTNIKNSRSLADKDQSVAGEQIQHAARNNVLILRTLDLLNLASLRLSGKLTAEDVAERLTKSQGWLRVDDGEAKVLSS